MSIMMLNTIIRRECNKNRCVLPFCIKLISKNSYFDEVCLLNSSVRNQSSLSKDNNQKDDSIKSNRYYDKYKEKIDKINSENKQNIQTNVNVNQEQNNQKTFQSNSSWESYKRSGNENSKFIKSLNDLVKVDLFKDKTADEITHIWSEYHKDKDCIYAVIPSKSYDKIFDLANQFPTFVYPILKSGLSQNDGKVHEFILAQFSNHQCYFTPLVEYQKMKENAQPCLIISHYPELQFEKGIVLMSGKYNKDVINCLEAQCLANQLQWYYCGDLKQKMYLYKFNKEPNLFQYMDLINELEKGFMN